MIILYSQCLPYAATLISSILYFSYALRARQYDLMDEEKSKIEVFGSVVLVLLAN